MPNETRVNLLHLLEDIRDSYALPIEEVIVTELIANALDSGASRIEFFSDIKNAILKCIDNGRGMRRKELREYHNIASTTKERGRGIGFAGVGAKLSLLVASQVQTQTHGPHRTRSATSWHLASSLRAPWKFIPCSSDFPFPKGTIVSIYLINTTSALLNPAFISHAIQKHFHPLLSHALQERVFHFLYSRGVELFVNGEKVFLSTPLFPEKVHFFPIFLGGKSRKPVGFGYIARKEENDTLPSYYEGITISTYGKVIKTGWEWLGILPKSFTSLYGVVEIPGLTELLTTNKTDFLRDAASLKKYYRYRKAIQDGVLIVLRTLGEERMSPPDIPRGVRPLTREIEEALGNLIGDFPELSPLLGIRKHSIASGLKEDIVQKESQKERAEYLAGIKTGNFQEANTNLHKRERGENKGVALSIQGEGGVKRPSSSPGLKIAFEEIENTIALAHMEEDTIKVNISHPAWQKAKAGGLEEYHILLTVAWILSGFLERDRSPQDFVNKFLFAWGKREKGSSSLFSSL